MHIQKLLSRIYFILLFLYLVLSTAMAQRSQTKESTLQSPESKEVIFPGKINCSASPNGKFQICMGDAMDSMWAYRVHPLLLTNVETGSIDTFFEYKRSIGVLWSPDGQAFAINDHYGSGE